MFYKLRTLNRHQNPLVDQPYLQENNEKQEDRLAKAILELAGACLRADGAVRKRIQLENEVSSNEESIDSLDKQLEESKFTLSASESKYDDISRKLATMEADAARGNEKAEVEDKKIRDIEEELKVDILFLSLLVEELNLHSDC